MNRGLTKFLDEVIRAHMHHSDPMFNNNSGYHVCGDSCLGAMSMFGDMYECSLHISNGPDNMMDEHEWFTIQLTDHRDALTIELRNATDAYFKTSLISGDWYQEYLKYKLRYM